MMIPVENQMRYIKVYNELDVQNIFENNKGLLTKIFFRPGKRDSFKPWGVIQRNEGASMMIPAGKEEEINIKHFDDNDNLARISFLLLLLLYY